MKIPKTFTSIQNTTNTDYLTENIQNCQDEENIICDYNDSLIDPIQAQMVSELPNTAVEYSNYDNSPPFLNNPMIMIYLLIILIILIWSLLVDAIYDLYQRNKRCRELTREVQGQLAMSELEVQLATVEIEAQSDTME